MFSTRERLGPNKFWAEILQGQRTFWQNLIDDVRTGAQIKRESVQMAFRRKEKTTRVKRMPIEWQRSMERYLTNLDQFVDTALIPRQLLNQAKVEAWVVLQDYHRFQSTKACKSQDSVNQIVERVFRATLQQCAERA